MQVVFEMVEGGEECVFVVDVRKIDDSTLFGVYNGALREFPISAVKNATTVSGRPFSLRPFVESSTVAEG